MPELILKFTEPAWPELADGKTVLHHTKDKMQVTALLGGMSSGAPSVALRIDLEDGSVVIAETSLALFLTAADGLKAKYGDPR